MVPGTSRNSVGVAPLNICRNPWVLMICFAACSGDVCMICVLPLFAGVLPCVCIIIFTRSMGVMMSGAGADAANAAIAMIVFFFVCVL